MSYASIQIAIMAAYCEHHQYRHIFSITTITEQTENENENEKSFFEDLRWRKVKIIRNELNNIKPESITGDRYLVWIGKLKAEN
jgi:hypothetical protein